MHMLRRLCHVCIAISLCVGLFAASCYSETSLLLHYDFDELAGDALDHGIDPPANGMLVGDAIRTANTPGGFSSAALGSFWDQHRLCHYGRSQEAR